MPSEHILFAEQSVDWSTWEAPDKAIPVTNFDPDPGIEYREHRASGTGRALVRSWLSSKQVSGTLSMAAWETYLGYFVKQALLHDVASALVGGAAAAYEHGFLPSDATVPQGLSVQALRSGNAQSFKGVLFNRLTFNVQAGEELTLDMDWLARDEAPAGGTWDDDGAAAPAALVPAYFGVDVPAFMFHQGTLIIGGTPTLDAPSKTYSFVGGTEYPLVEMAEVAIENNLDARIFLGLRVPRNVVGQDRAVTGRFDFDQSAYNAAFYDLYRGGQRAALRLTFAGTEIEAGVNSALEIVLPNVIINQGRLPAIQGAQDRRMQTVEFTGMADSNGVDIAVRLVDTEASY